MRSSSSSRGDRPEALAGQLGYHPLCSRWDGARFGQTGFSPPFELAEEHGAWYELVIVLGDDGFGLVLGLALQALSASRCIAFLVCHSNQGR